MTLVPASSSGAVAGAVGRVVLTTGNLTTTSGTFVDATGLTLTVTTGANRVLVGFIGTLFIAALGQGCAVDLAIDGTRQGGTAGLVQQAGPNAGGYQEDMSFTYLTAVLTAGSHTFKIQYVSDGTHTTTFQAGTVTPAVLWLTETNFST